jgi:hypothetical protein
MKFSLLSILFSSITAFEVSDELKKLNDKVFSDSKKMWTEQFAPFEESGFTEEMIVGAKDIYFSKDFASKMKCFQVDGIQMQLWTVSKGKIYLEESPLAAERKQ